MKKLLLLPIVLLIAACSPQEAADEVQQQTMEAITEIGYIAERSIMPYYPYFKEWQYCEINGEVYEDVTFMYTDLGLGYMVDDILYYELEMVVTYCETPILTEVE